MRQIKNNNNYEGDQFLYCVRVCQALIKHASFEIANGIFSSSLYLCLSNSLFFCMHHLPKDPNTSLHDMQDTIYRPIIWELRF